MGHQFTAPLGATPATAAHLTHLVIAPTVVALSSRAVHHLERASNHLVAAIRGYPLDYLACPADRRLQRLSISSVPIRA